MTESKKYVGTSTTPHAVKKLSRLKLAPRKVPAVKNKDSESEVRSIVSTSRSNVTSRSSGSMTDTVRKRHKSEMTSQSVSSHVTSDQKRCTTPERSMTYDSNSYKTTPKYFLPKLFEMWAPQLCTSYRPNVTYVHQPTSFAAVSSFISRLNMPVRFKTAETVVETCVHFQKGKQFGK